MNNDKVKIQFFAQYFGQHVRVWVHDKDNPQLVTYASLTPEAIHRSCLLLRTVDQLTDEEAVNLVGIAMYHPSIEDFTTDECASGDGDYNNDGSWWLEASARCWEGTLSVTPSFTFSLIDDNDTVTPVYNQMACTDYLRSIGILLPFTHLSDNKPVTLSTDEILNLGWAKIKSN